MAQYHVIMYKNDEPHSVYHINEVAMTDKDYYRSVTSMEAFSGRENKRLFTRQNNQRATGTKGALQWRASVQRDHEWNTSMEGTRRMCTRLHMPMPDNILAMKLPTYTTATVWDFYRAVNYDYKKKCYDPKLAAKYLAEDIGVMLSEDKQPFVINDGPGFYNFELQTNYQTTLIQVNKIGSQIIIHQFSEIEEFKPTTNRVLFKGDWRKAIKAAYPPVEEYYAEIRNYRKDILKTPIPKFQSCCLNDFGYHSFSELVMMLAQAQAFHQRIILDHYEIDYSDHWFGEPVPRAFLRILSTEKQDVFEALGYRDYKHLKSVTDILGIEVYYHVSFHTTLVLKFKESK